ncbi:MAG: hypothetical protein U5M51_03200 [Emticicia sp.]|nr:hypothetical protein [Emticicia sp.]
MLKNYINTFGLENSPSWQQKTRSFIQKYGIWILVILSVGIFFSMTNTNEMLTAFTKGYYDGCNCDEPKKEEMGIGLIMGLTLMLLMSITLIFFILGLLAKIFLHFFLSIYSTKKIKHHISFCSLFGY